MKKIERALISLTDKSGIEGFAGALDMKRARKGVFITTSQFSREAIDCVGMIE